MNVIGACADGNNEYMNKVERGNSYMIIELNNFRINSESLYSI